MSKPCELTIYPFVDRWVPWTEMFRGKSVSGESRETGYETPKGVFSGDEFPEKRLTSAELAAEYWRRMYAYAEANGFLESEVARRRLDIIGRFATHPHHDQEAA